jgi:hypothetical protein
MSGLVVVTEYVQAQPITAELFGSTVDGITRQ